MGTWLVWVRNDSACPGQPVQLGGKGYKLVALGPKGNVGLFRAQEAENGHLASLGQKLIKLSTLQKEI